MWLFLEAIDVWMFRDGKPFNAGESHIAYSLFPPSAITVQGALRTLLLDLGNIDPKAYFGGKAEAGVHTALGNPQNPGNLLGLFSLRGPFLARRYSNGEIERYVPLPQDVIANKKDDLHFGNTHLRTLQPGNQEISVDGLILRALDVKVDDEPPTSYWIPEGALTKYLRGETLSVRDCVKEENLFVREFRSGNALQYSRRHVRAEEGMLYSGSFIRPCDGVGLLVWLADEIAALLPDKGYLRLGGEGRATRFQVIKDSARVKVTPESPDVHNWRNDNPRLKVVFLTPAYFKRGWLPEGSAFREEQLVAAALGRPLMIGGWDLGRKEPRPVRRWVSVGSVYYFMFDNTDRPESMLLCEQPDGELPAIQLGFGQIAVGTWESA